MQWPILAPSKIPELLNPLDIPLRELRGSLGGEGRVAQSPLISVVLARWQVVCVPRHINS